jgi:lipoprotein YgeR
LAPFGGPRRFPRRKPEKAYRFAAREVKTIIVKAEHRLRFSPMSARFLQTVCLLLFLVSAATLRGVDGAYTIREGETLFAVARSAKVPVDVLRAFNGIADAARLKPGTVIRIPPSYGVKKGDTLYGIARQFSVPLAALQELNGLGQNGRIRTGDRLYIPAQEAADAGKTAAASAAGTPRGTDAQEGAMPAAAAGSAARLPPGMAWPLPGHREPVRGKIAGLVFFGTRGDVVRSATAGEVKWVAPYWGLGKIVLIKGPDGVILMYAGNEEILVNVGDRVTSGSQIARLGESPQGGGAKLYFSIQDAKSQTIDPEKYFSAKSRT